MSIHPSLKGALKSKKQRTVLKRIERVKLLMEKGFFKDEDIFKLPKTKVSRRLKIKKAAKEEKVATAEGAAAAPAAAAPAAKAQGKGKAEK
jgi:small basic protein (TIGR04137 family)